MDIEAARNAKENKLPVFCTPDGRTGTILVVNGRTAIVEPIRKRRGDSYPHPYLAEPSFQAAVSDLHLTSAESLP